MSNFELNFINLRAIDTSANQLVALNVRKLLAPISWEDLK
jgi:hypothetical protein